VATGLPEPQLVQHAADLIPHLGREESDALAEGAARSAGHRPARGPRRDAEHLRPHRSWRDARSPGQDRVGDL